MLCRRPVLPLLTASRHASHLPLCPLSIARQSITRQSGSLRVESFRGDSSSRSNSIRNEAGRVTWKAIRAPAADRSSRRAILETENSRGASSAQPKFPSRAAKSIHTEKDVTAFCAAEEYRMQVVRRVLHDAGYVIDPYKTALYPQVIHFQLPAVSSKQSSVTDTTSSASLGDVFVFPSGTVVAWDVDGQTVKGLVNDTFLPAAVNPHTHRIETEDLDYFEDANSEKSAIIGDKIRIGTRPSQDITFTAQAEDEDASPADLNKSRQHVGSGEAAGSYHDLEAIHSHPTNLVLAKIAFSSGLARSTKLAVLESLLDSYFASTSSIPSLLSAGVRLPASYRNRAFILRKTGELLSVRAQLNLTELTDKVPDLFWDARHELGLEGLYDQVGKALDVGWRIRVLNERVDYAAEIAEVLRGSASERHGLLLEWLIIGLIAVEVGFEGWKIWREQFAADDEDDTDVLVRRWLKKQLSDDYNGS